MIKKLYSEHLFLFPFSWKECKKDMPYLCCQHKTIYRAKLDNLPNWKQEYVSLEKDKDYNEFVYFYKSVRAALYTFENSPLIVRNYTYKHLDKENTFVMSVKQKVYNLTIDKISLKIYKSGVGILSIHLLNNQYSEPQDILDINSFSKCIYPYVLPIEKAQKELFPDYIKMKLNIKYTIEENFDKEYKTLPITISDIVMKLLGEPFSLQLRSKPSFIVEPILGNQMFVICLYQKEEMVDAINNKIIEEEFLEKFILLNDRVKGARNSTPTFDTGIQYIRNKETMYATSRFSLIAISKEIMDIKIYDQLVHLLLMQRATLLSFSNHLALVSTLPKAQLVPGIESIYEIYIQFVNQLYFKEVTEEIQGTKIYDNLSKQLRIEEELHQLDFEIEEVHEYATLIEQSGAKLRMSMITITGATLVIPTFVTGFFGMNILQKDWYDWWNHTEVILWLNAYVVVPILLVIGLYTWNGGETIKYKMHRIVILMGIILSIFILCKYGAGIT